MIVPFQSHEVIKRCPHSVYSYQGNTMADSNDFLPSEKECIYRYAPLHYLL